MMKAFQMLMGVTSIGVFLAACSVGEEPEPSTGSEPISEETEENEQQTNQPDETTEQENIESDDQTNESDTDDNVETAEEESVEAETEGADYTEQQIHEPFSLHGVWTHQGEQEISLLSFEYHVAGETTKEDRILESLKQSDFTSSQILDELDKVQLDDSTVELHFTADEKVTSMASTEQTMFSDMLGELAYLYGIEEIAFYVEDEPGILYGQTGEINGLSVESSENRGYYLLTDQEEVSTTYLSGGLIEAEQGAELGFSDAVQEMRIVEDEEAEYTAAIPDTVEIQEADISEDRTRVTYTMNGEWNEEAKEHFENALKLTTLDYGMEKLELVNETHRERTIYVLQ